MKPAIQVQGLSKKYNLSHSNGDSYLTLRESIVGASHNLLNRLRRKATPQRQKSDFWALKDVTFDIQPGEVVGIIGRNGAGKSTLLKILSRIVEPTQGRAEIHGRMGSLLEVGTGFHPELTGRENIYLNGAILGMKRQEITRKFDEIVAFSEIEQFLDTPVKRYSSGMYVRLAFAVAAHLEPEILIVDEVLAVGDQSFQKKCLGRIQAISRHGTTVLFVSHNLAAVENLCDRGVFLENGKLSYQGCQTEAIARYSKSLDSHTRLAHQWTYLTGQKAACDEQPAILAARVLPIGRDLDEPLRMGQPFQVEVLCFAPIAINHPSLGIGINSQTGQRVTTLHTSTDADYESHRLSGTIKFSCRLEVQSLMAGDYSLKLSFESGNHPLHVVEDALYFTILPSDFYGNGQVPFQGLVAFPQKWTVNSQLPEFNPTDQRTQS